MQIRSVQELRGQTCEICRDEIESTVEGEPFVACNECAFPVCRPCYEYERREGNQACPQCKTRYKRMKGSPRVENDEEEDDVDDIDNEFEYGGNGIGFDQVSEGVSVSRRHSGDLDSAPPGSQIPLLTYGDEVNKSH